jgi:hypothetical protein
MTVTRQIRVKRWTVRVTGTEHAGEYSVYAVHSWDARMLAYALAEGFTDGAMTEQRVNIALANTKILGST